MTLTEKILARAAGKAQVQAGENVWVKADILMTHHVSQSVVPHRVAGTTAGQSDRLQKAFAISRCVILERHTTWKSTPILLPRAVPIRRINAEVCHLPQRLFDVGQLIPSLIPRVPNCRKDTAYGHARVCGRCQIPPSIVARALHPSIRMLEAGGQNGPTGVCPDNTGDSSIRIASLENCSQGIRPQVDYISAVCPWTIKHSVRALGRDDTWTA